MRWLRVIPNDLTQVALLNKPTRKLCGKTCRHGRNIAFLSARVATKMAAWSRRYGRSLPPQVVIACEQTHHWLIFEPVATLLPTELNEAASCRLKKMYMAVHVQCVYSSFIKSAFYWSNGLMVFFNKELWMIAKRNHLFQNLKWAAFNKIGQWRSLGRRFQLHFLRQTIELPFFGRKLFCVCL